MVAPLVRGLSFSALPCQPPPVSVPATLRLLVIVSDLDFAFAGAGTNLIGAIPKSISALYGLTYVTRRALAPQKGPHSGCSCRHNSAGSSPVYDLPFPTHPPLPTPVLQQA